MLRIANYNWKIASSFDIKCLFPSYYNLSIEWYTQGIKQKWIVGAVMATGTSSFPNKVNFNTRNISDT